jgi:hypothetical protein
LPFVQNESKVADNVNVRTGRSGRFHEFSRFSLAVLAGNSILAISEAPFGFKGIDLASGRVARSLFLRRTEYMPSVGAEVDFEVDFIEELQLRRWARENYVPADNRLTVWHPVVLDEMTKKDLEKEVSQTVCTCA